MTARQVVIYSTAARARYGQVGMPKNGRRENSQKNE